MKSFEAVQRWCLSLILSSSFLFRVIMEVLEEEQLYYSLSPSSHELFPLIFFLATRPVGSYFPIRGWTQTNGSESAASYPWAARGLPFPSFNKSRLLQCAPWQFILNRNFMQPHPWLYLRRLTGPWEESLATKDTKVNDIQNESHRKSPGDLGTTWAGISFSLLMLKRENFAYKHIQDNHQTAIEKRKQ